MGIRVSKEKDIGWVDIERRSHIVAIVTAWKAVPRKGPVGPSPTSSVNEILNSNFDTTNGTLEFFYRQEGDFLIELN